MNTSAAPHAVEITGLSRTFGSKLALNEVSLRVRRGRVALRDSSRTPAGLCEREPRPEEVGPDGPHGRAKP